MFQNMIDELSIFCNFSKNLVMFLGVQDICLHLLSKIFLLPISVSSICYVSDTQSNIDTVQYPKLVILKLRNKYNLKDNVCLRFSSQKCSFTISSFLLVWFKCSLQLVNLKEKKRKGRSLKKKWGKCDRKGEK